MTDQKILVVEDHTDSCLWISAVLRQSGYAPITTGEGALAVRLARSHRPDLILLDLHLPCGGGEFVMDSLKKHPDTAGIPVIIMSGDTEMDDAALRGHGAVAIFRKPVDVNAFLACIHEWVGKTAPELVPA